MESNTMSGGMYPSLGSGMLGLEMSLNHHIPKQNAQNPPHPNMQQQNPHHPMVAYAPHHHEGEIQQQPQLSNNSAKQGGYNHPFATKSKNHSLTLSDDEDPAAGAGGVGANENSADDGKRKMSPWQRMKWTDNMVRLLIMVVYYIGDEAGTCEGNDAVGSGGIGKNKKVGGGVLQKKGKWKSVSRAMMERGFYVSPQQCEDKFNDLNKRYKRVNDILGKGTACRVVENQSLLETMDHLSPKMKEEAKKLLNSKHLFFREMCAYHNSCGHGGASSAQLQVSATEPCHDQLGQQQQSQPRCLHSTENATNFGANRGEMEGSKLSKSGRSRGEVEEEEEEEEEAAFEDDDEEDDDEDDDDDEEDDEDDDDTDERCGSGRKKRRRKGTFISPLIQQLSSELSNVFQDESKSASEKRQWMRNRLMQLEEQHAGYEYRAFEIEKQRLKWVKFRSKKEREMERDKLSNDRMKVENERMSLLIRQKEIELLDLYQHHHQTSRKSDPSSITG